MFKKESILIKEDSYNLVQNFREPLREEDFQVKSLLDDIILNWKNVFFYALILVMISSILFSFMGSESSKLFINYFLLVNLFCVAPMAILLVNRK